MEDLPALRRAMGNAAAVWSGQGRHVVEASRWLALSGAMDPSYNVITCFGEAVELVEESLRDVDAAGAPSIIMLAADALGSAQVLADAGWVCVGAVPFLHTDPSTRTDDPDPSVRRLDAGELTEARDVFAEAFPDGERTADLALPEGLTEQPGVWLCGIDAADGSTLASVMISVVVGDTFCPWSLATRVGNRRMGLGGRVLGSATALAGREGARHAIFHASAAGLSLYRSMGFEVVEYWQEWSRPRWIMGRA